MRYLDYTISKPKLLIFQIKICVKNNYYEAHSTDYQSLKTLKIPKNNFKFLKVGPELTYHILDL